MTRTTPAPFLDVADLVPEFATRSRVTVRLHPRSGDSPAHCSKIGGQILWPPDEPWPHCAEHDSPFVSVLQLTKDDLPELGFRTGYDVFQLLWCPNRHSDVAPQFYPTPAVFWRRLAEIPKTLKEAPSPTNSEDRFCPNSSTIHPERVTEFPDVSELTEEIIDRMNSAPEVVDACHNVHQDADFACAYQAWLSVASGWKVGGYPHWVQDPETPCCSCGMGMEYLLTVSSAEFDGGSWQRWLAEEERDVWGGDYKQRWAVQCAPDISLGDMGSINVFICRTCDSWPVSAVCQGS